MGRGENAWPQPSPAGSKQARCERAFLRPKWQLSLSRRKPESSALPRTHRTRRYCCKPAKRFSIIWTVYDHNPFFMEKEYRPVGFREAADRSQTFPSKDEIR